jgi:DNA-binding GntR family transcriptional regulator
MVVIECPGRPREPIIVPINLTYRGIADDLAARIRAGEYRPGSKLPSYSEIAELYSVSLSTATRAIGLLRDRGLVEGVVGVGVYVCDLPPSG